MFDNKLKKLYLPFYVIKQHHCFITYDNHFINIHYLLFKKKIVRLLVNNGHVGFFSSVGNVFITHTHTL